MRGTGPATRRGRAVFLFFHLFPYAVPGWRRGKRKTTFSFENESFSSCQRFKNIVYSTVGFLPFLPFFLVSFNRFAYLPRPWERLPGEESAGRGNRADRDGEASAHRPSSMAGENSNRKTHLYSQLVPWMETCASVCQIRQRDGGPSPAFNGGTPPEKAQFS